MFTSAEDRAWAKDALAKMRTLERPSYTSIPSRRCLYRGPNGARCAVGVLIPDEKYDEAWDRSAVSVDGSAALCTVVDATTEQRVDFLRACQRLHDGAVLSGLPMPDDATWRRMFRDSLLKIEAAYVGLEP